MGTSCSKRHRARVDATVERVTGGAGSGVKIGKAIDR